jgi:hypothetical protein
MMKIKGEVGMVESLERKPGVLRACHSIGVYSQLYLDPRRSPDDHRLLFLLLGAHGLQALGSSSAHRKHAINGRTFGKDLSGLCDLPGKVWTPHMECQALYGLFGDVEDYTIPEAVCFQ